MIQAKKKLLGIRERRKHRVRAKIFGTAEKPRLSVFRSNQYTYAQLIDDAEKKTLFFASSRNKGAKGKKQDGAKQVGRMIGEKAVQAGIKRAVLDRGAYRYHGRVQALAEAAKEAGLMI